MAFPAADQIPLPEINTDTQPFWDAASRRELGYGRCPSCGKAFFFPRNFCPFCFADAELAIASGKGEIYAVTVVRKGEPPYALAFVRLEEGPSMFTNIVDCDLDALEVGQRVEVVFAPSEGGPLIPMFRPV
jgi:uncharacterized OB-fold protein